MKLQQEKHELELEVQDAQWRVDQGQPPNVRMPCRVLLCTTFGNYSVEGPSGQFISGRGSAYMWPSECKCRSYHGERAAESHPENERNVPSSLPEIQ